jgi:ribosomal protein S18 acetylase RimI-like enzyme
VIKITEAGTDQVSLVRELFLEYAQSLDFKLCFQGFDKELAELPGKYAPPKGFMLLAYSGSELAGCVAMQPIDSEICEMKRLYVRPQFQGQGIGKSLVLRLIDKSKSAAYKKMRLDTVPSMKAALGLYGSLGFYKIPPYRENPIPGAEYLEKIIS